MASVKIEISTSDNSCTLLTFLTVRQSILDVSPNLQRIVNMSKCNFPSIHHLHLSSHRANRWRWSQRQLTYSEQQSTPGQIISLSQRQHIKKTAHSLTHLFRVLSLVCGRKLKHLQRGMQTLGERVTTKQRPGLAG